MAADERNLSQLIRQFQLLEGVKTKLIKMGAISADASNEQLVAALKQVVPADLFPKQKTGPAPGSA